MNFAHSVSEAHNYRLGWYDLDQTILVLEILGAWTWQEALEVILEKVRVCALERAPTPIYIVHIYHTRHFPQERGAIQALRRMTAFDVPNEALIILIRQSSALATFLDIALRAFHTFKYLGKIRSAQNFEQALSLIQADKNARLQHEQSVDQKS